MERVELVFHSKRGVLSAFIPKTLFLALRKRAREQGVAYKRFILHALDRAVTGTKNKPRRAKAKAG